MVAAGTYPGTARFWAGTQVPARSGWRTFVSRKHFEDGKSLYNRKTASAGIAIIRYRQFSLRQIQMKLRVGIVGLGDSWENGHRPALRTLPTALRSAASAVKWPISPIRRLATFMSSPWTAFELLCARPDVDAVLILSPQWYGPLPILAACENGKSVYCGAALDIADPEEANLVKRRSKNRASPSWRNSPAALRRRRSA